MIEQVYEAALSVEGVTRYTEEAWDDGIVARVKVMFLGYMFNTDLGQALPLPKYEVMVFYQDLHDVDTAENQQAFADKFYEIYQAFYSGFTPISAGDAFKVGNEIRCPIVIYSDNPLERTR